MNRVGFDNDKYVKLQSQNIRDRINKFGGKLYLEFGGKLFDDYHARGNDPRRAQTSGRAAVAESARR